MTTGEIQNPIREAIISKSQFEQARKARLVELTAFAEDAYPKWMEQLSREIKEDTATKSISLLTGLSAFCNDPQNFMMKGESSIGKTWNAMNTVCYFPEEDLWLLGGLSPTALVHDYGVLEHAETGEPLDEDWVWNRWMRGTKPTPRKTSNPKVSTSASATENLDELKRSGRKPPRNTSSISAIKSSYSSMHLTSKPSTDYAPSSATTPGR